MVKVQKVIQRVVGESRVFQGKRFYLIGDYPSRKIARDKATRQRNW